LGSFQEFGKKTNKNIFTNFRSFLENCGKFWEIVGNGIWSTDGFREVSVDRRIVEVDRGGSVVGEDPGKDRVLGEIVVVSS
jgi:hypothetical protein